MGKSDVTAALAAGITGALTVFSYYTISLPLLFHIAPIDLYIWDASNALGYQAASQANLLTIIFVGQSAHVVVSVVWGFVFVVLLRVFPAIRRRLLIWGFLYGVAVMLFMRNIIVPLGHAPPISYTLPSFLNALIAHSLFFGVPVVWVATRLTKA